MFASIAPVRSKLISLLIVVLLIGLLPVLPAPAGATPSGPFVTTYGPVNNATQVLVNSNLTLAFNESVTVVSGKIVVIKNAATNAVVETMNVGGPGVTVSGNTVTINPVYDLLYNTAYYVQIDAGAFQSASSQDYAGISDTVTWTFTTELRSEVTASDTASFNAYMDNPLVSVIQLVAGRTYDYEGGTVSRSLEIRGNGATIRAGAGVPDTVVRADGVVFTLGNYSNVRTFLRVEGPGSHLKMDSVTLQNGNNEIFATINVKTAGTLTLDTVTFKDFHNNSVPGDNLSFGVHAEPGALSTTIRGSTFDSSNAYRNAVAIRSGSMQITGNTFRGTDYPRRLRQSDGYEYAMYIYGGTGTITGNTVTGYVSTTQLGYSSAGISVIGFYSTNVNIQNNVLQYNKSGIDITRTWAAYTTNRSMIVNGNNLTTVDEAFSIGEQLKAANTQDYVSVSLDQDDVVMLTSPDNNKYYAVLGGYRSPYLTVTQVTYESAVIQFSAQEIDALTAATSIALQRQVDDGPWTTLPTTWTGIPSNVTVQLETGHTNRFRAKLTHSSSTTPPAALVTYSNGIVITAPGTPMLTGATAGDGSASLTWNPVAGATGYTVYESATSGTYGSAVQTVAGTVYGATIAGLTNGTTYYFSVRATIGSVDSAYSSQLSATPPPGTPLLMSVIGGDSSASLTWNPVAGTTGYTVYQSVTSGTYGSEVLTVAGTESGAVITGLMNGTTYYFSVRAKIGSVVGAYSNQLSVTPPPGTPLLTSATAADSSVALTWNPVAGATGYTVYQSTVSGMNGTAAVTVAGSVDGTTVSGLTNGTTYYFSVRATIGSVDGSHSNQLSATPAAVPGNNGGSGGSGGTPPAPNAPSTSNVEVLVNGKVENAGTAVESKRGDQSVTTISVDPKKLEDRLAAEGLGTVITIPVKTQSDVVVGQLSGAMIRSMENKQATIEIRTESASYFLPAQQINISGVSAQLGSNVKLENIQVNIEIAKPSEAMRLVLNKSAADQSFTVMVPAVDFVVTAVSGSSTVEISRFNVYVERQIAIPKGVDPNRITTGVVVESDGTIRHVPTRVVQRDGRYYAEINSMTNSTYSVIWNPKQFGDMADHWAKGAVNEMGSRMIVEGREGGRFVPDAAVTRAEFTAILVRGLGLKKAKTAIAYTDVRPTDWYYDAIVTAQDYKLIDGFEDGAFRPLEPISREQAMVILDRAMTLTGLAAQLKEKAAALSALEGYTDAGSVSSWAIAGVVNSFQSGLVSGRADHFLAARELITRAETAVLIQRLLQKSELI